MKATVAALLTALLATSAAAQPSLAEVCRDVDMPTRAEYESNAIAYADNFCALATYAPHRAARQFDSMVSLVRAHNNPNSHYWDRRFEPTAEHLQLLRPWMADRNWQVVRLRPPYWMPYSLLFAVDNARDQPKWDGDGHRAYVHMVIGGGVVFPPHMPRYSVSFHRRGAWPSSSGLRAVITRSGNQEYINFTTDLAFYEEQEMGKGNEDLVSTTSETIARLVHSALDCLGKDNGIYEAIRDDPLGREDRRFDTEYYEHYFCDIGRLAE